jgi:ribosome-associated protein
VSGVAASRRIRIRPAVVLEESDLEWRFVRGSGPGGQNVNKVATSAQVRFEARRRLPPDVFARLQRIAGRRLSQDGVLTVTARAARTQERNRAQALDRLVELLRAAAEPPAPRTPTRTPPASRARRLDSKRRRAGTKDRRRKVTHLDD